jgi:transcription elongation factor Elf1
MSEITKEFHKDDMKISLSFSTESSIEETEIESIITSNIMQLFDLIRRSMELKTTREATKNSVFKDRKCPVCGNVLVVKKPCCSERKKLLKLLEKGIVAILACMKCGQRLWVKSGELDNVA